MRAIPTEAVAGFGAWVCPRGVVKQARALPSVREEGLLPERPQPAHSEEHLLEVQLASWRGGSTKYLWT